MREFLKTISIERIPTFAAYIYSIIAAKNPILKDFYKKIAEEVVEELDSGKILDVGTGPGYLPLEIAKRSATLEITGIDLSPTMVKIAVKNAESMGLSQRVKFQIANASALPFDSGYFDLVVSSCSFHHWLQPAKCLKEIYHVLKKGGKAWIYDINHDIPKESKKELRNEYGLFLASFFVYVVRAHSSVKLEEFEEVLSHLSFFNNRIENRGYIFKLELCK